MSQDLLSNKPTFYLLICSDFNYHDVLNKVKTVNHMLFKYLCIDKCCFPIWPAKPHVSCTKYCLMDREALLPTTIWNITQNDTKIICFVANGSTITSYTVQVMIVIMLIKDQGNLFYFRTSKLNWSSVNGSVNCIYSAQCVPDFILNK